LVGHAVYSHDDGLESNQRVLSEKRDLSGADRSPKVQIAEKVCLHNNMDQCAMWHNAQHCSKVISPNRNAATKVT